MSGKTDPGNPGMGIPARAAGVYTEVASTSNGTGTGAKFDVVVDANGTVTDWRVSYVPNQPGQNLKRRFSGDGYKVGDEITIAAASIGGNVDLVLKVADLAHPIDPTLPARTARNSSLPISAIEAAIQNQISSADITVTNDGGCGDFLCEYMAYHDAWYVAWTQTKARLEDVDIHEKAEAGGFTHIGIDLDLTVGQKAVKIQLEELIKVLEKDY